MRDLLPARNDASACPCSAAGASIGAERDLEESPADPERGQGDGHGPRDHAGVQHAHHHVRRHVRDQQDRDDEREDVSQRLGPAPREDLAGVAGEAGEEPPHLHQARVADHPDGDRGQHHHEAVRDRDAAGEGREEGRHPRGVEHPALLHQGDDHEDRTHDEVRRGPPVDPSAGDEELLVDRLEQQEVQVSGPHQFRELVAVLQEQGLDQPVQGEEAADEEEVIGLAPVGDVAGLREHGAVEGDQDAHPEQLDRHLDQEVAAEGHLAGQGEAGQPAHQPRVSGDARDHGSTSVGAVAPQARAVERPRQDEERDRPEQFQAQVEQKLRPPDL
ncbi:hypothetical protein HK102_010947, partial [Quaeritorhiza haematococci]